jgi:hypothetical protein
MKISQNVNEKNTKNTEDRGGLIIEGSGSGASLFLPRVSEGVLLIGEATGHHQQAVHRRAWNPLGPREEVSPLKRCG